jgi:hypothetical protein
MISKIKNMPNRRDGRTTFVLMHRELEKAGCELHRLTKNRGIICINVGDATRRIGNGFQHYHNHSWISHTFTKLRFVSLPTVLWNKQTGSWNKFMSSGMLPPNAYITLAHEYIVFFRKGAVRRFVAGDEKTRRKKVPLSGRKGMCGFQTYGYSKAYGRNTRNRSAAFGFEQALDLINIFDFRKNGVRPLCRNRHNDACIDRFFKKQYAHAIDPGLQQPIGETFAALKAGI